MNQACIELVKQFEGCRLEAYPDPATGGAPWTIGYGSTGGVHPGEIITQAEAERLLGEDLKRAEVNVRSFISVPLNENQLAALISFCYNCGAGNLMRSTLRIRLNKHDYLGAAEELLKWNKAAGKVMAGLVRRRQAEHDLFLKEMT